MARALLLNIVFSEGKNKKIYSSPEEKTNQFLNVNQNKFND